MLEDETKHDRIRRHDNDFDKVTGQLDRFVWTRSRRMQVALHKSAQRSY
jgi:hypothetical protein